MPTNTFLTMFFFVFLVFYSAPLIADEEYGDEWLFFPAQNNPCGELDGTIVEGVEGMIDIGMSIIAPEVPESQKALLYLSLGYLHTIGRCGL